jgi:hypothetical protein
MFEGLGNSRDMATTWKLFLDQNLEATHSEWWGWGLNTLKVVEKMDSVGPRFMLKKDVRVWHHMTLKYVQLHTHGNWLKLTFKRTQKTFKVIDIFIRLPIQIGGLLPRRTCGKIQPFTNSKLGKV